MHALGAYPTLGRPTMPILRLLDGRPSRMRSVSAFFGGMAGKGRKREGGKEVKRGRRVSGRAREHARGKTATGEKARARRE